MIRTLAALFVTRAVITGCATGHDPERAAAAASPSAASAPPPALTPDPSTPTPAAPPTPSATLTGIDGDLQPGTYTAQLPVGETLAVTFTVPGGWTAYADPPGVVRGLWPRESPGTGAPGGIAIQFLDVTTLKGDPCHWSGHDHDIPVGATAHDLVQALQEQTAYEASAPVDVTIGGHAGQRVDIVSPVKPFDAESDVPGCDEGRWRFWDGEIYAQGPANRWQTNILDVDGTRVVIVLQDFPGTSAADRAKLDAIADSMLIKP
jgi:hypothetical protein